MKCVVDVFEMVMGMIDVDVKIKEIMGMIDMECLELLCDLCGNCLGLKLIVWIGILLLVFQQFVGINVIFYYFMILWQFVGFDEFSVFFIFVIILVMNIVVMIVVILFVDKIGWCIMLLVGLVGMIVILGFMVVVFLFGMFDVQGIVMFFDFWVMIVLICVNGFVVFFGVSWGLLVWVLLGEIFLNLICVGVFVVVVVVQWVVNFFIFMMFLVFVEIGFIFVYGFYVFFVFLLFFFVFFKVFEIKGKEFEEMSENMKVECWRGLQLMQVGCMSEFVECCVSLEVLCVEVVDEFVVFIQEWFFGGEDFWEFMEELLSVDELVVYLLCVDNINVNDGV